MFKSSEKGLPKLFLPLLGGASIISVFIIWFNLNIFFLALSVSVPLFIYYFKIKKNLDHSDYNTVDSVYYFGFSLTIVTLATSAIIHFGLSSEIEDLQNLNLVFSQFGIGLLVTCLGLILRLSLLASMSKDSQDEEQNARQSLIHDISELREEITGFAHELESININLQQQQKVLNTGIIDGLKQATSEFQQQCLKVQDTLIENQKQKNHELADYQTQLQKELYQHMQQMNETLYTNMQQANKSHMAYIDQSQKHLLKLATDVGQSIHNLKFDEVAQSAKNSVQLVTQAYDDMQSNLTHFNHDMQQISSQYIQIHKQHQQQLQQTLLSTKSSVDSVNEALIEVATKASEKMKKTQSSKSAEQIAG